MKVVTLKQEGQLVPWYMGYVRRRFDYLADEFAVYPISFILQFFYWFRYKTYYRPKYEREVTSAVEKAQARGYKQGKSYWYRQGKNDVYCEIRDALGRGWGLTSSGVAKINDEGKLTELRELFTDAPSPDNATSQPSEPPTSQQASPEPTRKEGME